MNPAFAFCQTLAAALAKASTRSPWAIANDAGDRFLGFPCEITTRPTAFDFTSFADDAVEIDGTETVLKITVDLRGFDRDLINDLYESEGGQQSDDHHSVDLCITEQGIWLSVTVPVCSYDPFADEVAA
jgi:hypothetical protein